MLPVRRSYGDAQYMASDMPGVFERLGYETKADPG